MGIWRAVGGSLKQCADLSSKRVGSQEPHPHRMSLIALATRALAVSNCRLALSFLEAKIRFVLGGQAKTEKWRRGRESLRWRLVGGGLAWSPGAGPSGL